MKLKDAYRETISLLSGIYDKNEAISITRILFDELNLGHLKIVSDPGYKISHEKQVQLRVLRTGLLKKIPIQYVLGYAWFYDRRYRVNPSCLIPRQETEELIHLVKNTGICFREILDIGTGSGCIAISLKAEFPKSKVWAMEKYHDTLETAIYNSKINETEVHFLQDDILNPGQKNYPENFDLIISNPPYVRESEKINMHENVLGYEPERALFVEDRDPLIFFRAIRDFSLKKLNPGGHLFLEINEALGRDTYNIFKNEKFAQTEIIRDIHGKERFIKTIRSE